MNIQSFVADGKDFKRAGDILLESKRQQEDKPEHKDCTWLINNLLNPRVDVYRGKTFVEARDASGKLCGISIYNTETPSILYVDFLCSDCEGTGTQILNYISAKASAEGKTKIGLSAVPRAAAFYQKVGFVTPPEEEGMYMEKTIVPKPAGPAPAGAVDLPGGRRKAYRRRKSRRYGLAALRRHKTRRVLSR
jgi:hypothetical protein